MITFDPNWPALGIFATIFIAWVGIQIWTVHRVSRLMKTGQRAGGKFDVAIFLAPGVVMMILAVLAVLI